MQINFEIQFNKICNYPFFIGIAGFCSVEFGGGRPDLDGGKKLRWILTQTHGDNSRLVPVFSPSLKAVFPCCHKGYPGHGKHAVQCDEDCQYINIHAFSPNFMFGCHAKSE